MSDPIHINVQLDPLPGHALTVEQAVAATMNALCHALLPAEGQDRVADLAVTADPPPTEPGVHWRTLYQHHGPDDHDGELVGLMDTPELAAKVAQAVNAQTGREPAECHTDGAAAGDGPTASPDGESTCCCEEAAELRERVAETEEAQHDTAGQLRNARRQVETWRKRALDLGAEHDDRDRHVVAAALRWVATYIGGSTLAVLAEQLGDGDPAAGDLMAYVDRALSNDTKEDTDGPR